MQQAEPFRLEPGGELIDPRHVAARLVERGDQAELHWIAADREDDGNRRGRLLGGARAGKARHDEDGHLMANEIGHQGGHAIEPPLRKTILNCRVLSFDGARCLQPVAKCSKLMVQRFRRSGTDESDDRQHRLLRARREWPSGRAA